MILALLILAGITTIAYHALRADRVALKRADRAFAKGDHREAVLRYREAFSRGDAKPLRLLNLAEAHLALGEADDAERVYERVLREDAENESARNRLILMNVRHGRFERAAELYRQHLLRKPRSRAAWIGLARVLAYAGRFEEAAAAYRKFLGEEG